MSNLITSRPKYRFLRRIRPVQKKRRDEIKKRRGVFPQMPKRFPLNTEMFPFDTEKLILTNQPVEDKKGCCRCGSTYTLLLLLILLLLPSSSPPSKKKRTIGDDVFSFPSPFPSPFPFTSKRYYSIRPIQSSLIFNTLALKIHFTKTS